MYDFSVMPRYRFHRLDKIHFEYMAIGSICVYDLSVSIRYACGTFIIFSMRCTLSLAVYLRVCCAVLCCNVFSSPIDTSIVCAVCGTFFFCCLCNDVGLFHIDIRIRYVWSNRKPIDQIEQSNWEAILRYQNVFINLAYSWEKRRNNNTTYTHQSSFFSFSFNTLLFYLFNSFFFVLCVLRASGGYSRNSRIKVQAINSRSHQSLITETE